METKCPTKAAFANDFGSLAFDKSIITEFEATCILGDNVKWQKFVKILLNKKKARIVLNSYLECNGEKVGYFEGALVAIIL